MNKPTPDEIKQMIGGAIKDHEGRLHKRSRMHVIPFIKPTIKEIDAYCIEKGVDVLPDYIWCFYEKKDWKVGKNLMKNWRAAVSQAQYWENAPRRKLPSKPNPEAEKRNLEKTRAKIREEDGRYFREQSIEQLQKLRKADIMTNRRWLIDEVLAEKSLGL